MLRSYSPPDFDHNFTNDGGDRVLTVLFGFFCRDTTTPTLSTGD